MKPKLILASLLGSLSVYVAMVACTKSDHVSLSSGGAGGSGHGGQSGQGGQDDAGLMDVLSDAVPDAAADPISGSRLKAKYRVGEDGSKAYLPYIWYDSERKEDCGFAPAADGKERCLPIGTSNATAGLYFSDPACSASLGVFSYPGCDVKYITLATSGGGCPFSSSKTQVFALGAKANLATVYVKSGASCTAVSAAGIELYEIGAEILPTSFVAGSVLVDN